MRNGVTIINDINDRLIIIIEAFKNTLDDVFGMEGFPKHSQFIRFTFDKLLILGNGLGALDSLFKFIFELFDVSTGWSSKSGGKDGPCVFGGLGVLNQRHNSLSKRANHGAENESILLNPRSVGRIRLWCSSSSDGGWGTYDTAVNVSIQIVTNEK